MTELRQLTGARGVAAWWVVLYHLRGSIAGLPGWAEAVLAKGYLAVDFFFLLSGFVIWLTWHDRLRSPGTTALFLRKRVARVWPLHLVMLACAAMLALALAASGHPDPAFPAAELPLHLLLVQEWGFADALRWNDPAWSISAEAAAYLLFAAVAPRLDWRRMPTAGLLAIAAALLLALHLVMRGQPGLGAEISRFGLIRCLAEFATGTIIGALWLRSGGRHAAAVAAAFGILWVAGAAETLVVPAAFAALLLAIAHTPRVLGGSIFHWLGQVSYATYLSHFLLWKVAKLTLVRDASAVPPLVVALYLALVLVASAVLYHGIERPAQRWVNAFRIRRALPPALRSAP